MKKIAIISVSVFALGAAAIAADADGMLPLAHGLADITASSPAAAAETGKQGIRIKEHAIERRIRLVSSGIASVDSCDAAYWPYYPVECLKRVETAGL
ncbi:hypothetical protein [Hoeflea sp. AS16]|uniref:hypothetical protein n=1 Tax=Hoeflea sp. AS16 TaxID=3135779 RepID=UPI003180EEF2